MRFIYGVLILFFVVLLVYLAQPKEPLYLKEVIDGHVFIFGRIISIQRSGNHGFAIYKLLLDSSDISMPATVGSKKGLYLPFQIKNDTAEVYGAISLNDDDTAVYLTLNSATDLITAFDKKKKFISESFAYLIVEDVNRSYICNHTIVTPCKYRD